MELVEIRDVLNDSHHLESRWMIFTDPNQQIYFQSACGAESHALSIDEAERVAQNYLTQPVN